MLPTKKTLPWKIGLEEFTSTEHQASIVRTLSSINNERLFITMVSGLYRSGNTVLTGFDTNNLLIGKPLDWRESISSAKIYFRDVFKVWNFFRIKVVCATHDTIYTTIPDKIHRLQRRQHFRVAPPLGSTASFIQAGQRFNSAVVSDISAGGMLISTDANAPAPDDRSTLRGIMIRIPSWNNDMGSHTLLPLIREGQVVRKFIDTFTNRTFLGVSFAGNQEIKDEISKYVMHREQEILRQNLKPASPFPALS